MKPSIHPSKELSDQAIAWIVRLHSGEASAGEWGDFRKWREQSAEHDAAAAEAEMLWSDASELHRDRETGLIKPGRGRRGTSRRAVLGGLVVVAAMGGSAIWARRAGQWGADFATGTAETRVIRLEDGSSATLNAQTAIDVEFGAHSRRITLLKGQAFFEVVTDANRPFSVQAQNNTVVALGTAFDVDMNLPAGGVAVSVTQHSVKIDSGIDASFVLDEGQRVVISPTGLRSDVENKTALAATAWRNGSYVAEGRRLDEVAAALSAYHDGWIVVQGERARSLRVNAVLDLARPDDSLNALAEGLPVKVRRLSRYLTVITGA